MTEKADRLERALVQVLRLKLQKDLLLEEMTSQQRLRDEKFRQLAILRERIERRDRKLLRLHCPTILSPSPKRQSNVESIVSQ